MIELFAPIWPYITAFFMAIAAWLGVSNQINKGRVKRAKKQAENERRGREHAERRIEIRDEWDDLAARARKAEGDDDAIDRAATDPNNFRL